MAWSNNQMQLANGSVVGFTHFPAEGLGWGPVFMHISLNCTAQMARLPIGSAGFFSS